MEIIIVEDDLILSQLEKYIVESVMGHKPILFKNGREALDFLDDRAGRSEDVLVLLDLNMPVMNGWEFIDACQIRAYGYNVHIVIVTSSLFREDREKAGHFRQVIGYYTKPLRQEDIEEIMQIKEIAHLFKLPLNE